MPRCWKLKRRRERLEGWVQQESNELRFPHDSKKSLSRSDSASTTACVTSSGASSRRSITLCPLFAFEFNRLGCLLLGTLWCGLSFLPGLHHLPLLFRQQIAQMVELASAFELLAAVHHDLFSIHIARLVAHQECR